MKTFKDYVVEQLVEMGIEDHEGNYYQGCEIHDRLDDFIEDVTKAELIEWGNDFKNEINDSYEELKENIKEQETKKAYKKRNPNWLIDGLMNPQNN